MHRGLALFGFLLATTLYAQDELYRDAYISHVEGEVSLQRASESEPQSGSLNVPILPGDRVWTHASSRAEIRFGSGMVIHLSESAKLDFVANDSETILRLWSGSAILAIPEATGALRIDSPAGSIRPTREGSYRIDVEGGDAVTLSVERGSAELASSLGTVLVQSGETSFATSSDPPSIPVKFNTARLDELDRWSESRLAQRARTEDIVVRSLPHQVRSYAYELSDHGDWYQEPDYGYVWYPRVEVGWAPYTYGRWGYTHFGHTWISSEPWGWAPYHYGRWGFGHRGWYWIPGASWGPAWVSFAIGPTWVGWSPLGYHNRPIFAFNSYFGGYGNSYYRRGRYNHHRGGWNVCSRDDFRSGVVTRAGYRRLEPESLRASVGSARFVDGVSSLDRDLNPRTARLRTSGSGEARSLSAEAARLRPSGPSGPSGSGIARGRSAEATPRTSGAREANPTSARNRSEEALRGFRERAATPPRSVIDDTRTASRRGDRPSENSGVVRRTPERQGASEGRERPAREIVESTRRSPASRSIEGSRAIERSEASPSTSRTSPQSRERFERARERVIPILPARETPTTRSASPTRSSTRAPDRSLESRGTRARAPETWAPESARPESRSRVQRAEPTRRGRSIAEAPSRAREMSSGFRSTRERSSSVGSSSGNERRGGESAQRARGSSSSRSNPSGPSGPSGANRSNGSRGNARARSNQR
jgi:FecR protein